jgi:hypothetical protein
MKVLVMVARCMFWDRMPSAFAAAGCLGASSDSKSAVGSPWRGACTTTVNRGAVDQALNRHCK